MPIMRREDFGTESTGVINIDYCYYCYWKGKLLDPEITVDKMIERAAARLIEMNKMTQEKAMQVSKNLIPKLKRWQAKEGPPKTP
ncbi:MAG: zinc ribbon domain-containing protein [Deltaproteobacteria bacterium]|nr:zinc ribbon domain-containing protein [Deltaproteobacteria bacterium]